MYLTNTWFERLNRESSTAKMHWHPHNINDVLTGGVLRFNMSDGTLVEVDLTDDQVISSTEESYHAVENIGDSAVDTIQIELKF